MARPSAVILAAAPRSAVPVFLCSQLAPILSHSLRSCCRYPSCSLLLLLSRLCTRSQRAEQQQSSSWSCRVFRHRRHLRHCCFHHCQQGVFLRTPVLLILSSELQRHTHFRLSPWGGRAGGKTGEGGGVRGRRQRRGWRTEENSRHRVALRRSVEAAGCQNTWWQ